MRQKSSARRSRLVRLPGMRVTCGVRAAGIGANPQAVQVVEKQVAANGLRRLAVRLSRNSQGKQKAPQRVRGVSARLDRS